MSRALRAMNYRKLIARPRHHSQAEGAIEEFKKISPRAWRRSRTRRWAKRGSRPSAPAHGLSLHLQRDLPEGGQGRRACPAPPRCDTQAMNLHLAEISKHAAPGAHAALLIDQAGWHLAAALNLPANITIVPLPAKCPELSPQENVWQFMRDNSLSNRVFKS